MPALNKYKVFLILNNSNYVKREKIIINKKYNYVYTHRDNFFRSFLYAYAFFLISDCFSQFSYANNPEFVIKANAASLLLITGSFNKFYSF